MVSNSSTKNINRTYLLRPIFIIGLLVSLSSSSFAEDIKSFYSSTIQNNGILYFIEPEFEFENKKDKSEFTFDLTHISSEDSIVINFTYTAKDIYEFSELIFDTGDKKITAPANIIFIEARNKIWYHRYSSKFLLSDVEEIFQTEKKASVSIVAKNSIQTVNIRQRKWDKKSHILKKIITVINANK